MLFLNVKVFPNSGKHIVMVDKSGVIRCYIKAVPEKGRANCEVVKLLATVCNASQKDVVIKRGLTNRKKYVAIDVDLNFEQFLALLHSGIQKKIF